MYTPQSFLNDARDILSQKLSMKQNLRLFGTPVHYTDLDPEFPTDFGMTDQACVTDDCKRVKATIAIFALAYSVGGKMGVAFTLTHEATHLFLPMSSENHDHGPAWQKLSEELGIKDGNGSRHLASANTPEAWTDPQLFVKFATLPAIQCNPYSWMDMIFHAMWPDQFTPEYRKLIIP